MTSFGDTMRECIKFCSACPKQALALALGMIVLSGGDLMKVIPFFGTVVASPFFPFFHETHDLLALGLALYAAYKWHPAIGTGLVILFLAAHVPYFFVRFPEDLPALFRLLFLVTIALFGVHLIHEQYLAIAERKCAEEELEKYTKILETNSAKLTEYAIELKKTNELKDLFTDIMRHDLLNPIGIIKNLTEFLAEEESLKGLWEEVEVLQRNVRKLEEMIESASKLAKIESMEKIEFQRQDLNAILKKVIESFEPVFKEKGMRVEYSAKGEYPARANPVIEDVFLNLISNAIKYSPEKSRIIVGIEDGGEVWKIGVKDHGEGVPDEYKEAIFERFKRADRMGVKGTGLGLAIVREIVELHRGRVWVEDNPEGGSIFYVMLPKI